MDNVLNFLNSWLENKGTLNPSDTDTLKEFMAGLGTEIDKLSIAPPQGASKLILYGGMNGDVPMWQIAESASNSGQGYYYISQTEAGSILNDDELKDTLKEICDNDDLYNKVFGNPVNNKRNAYVVDGELSINDRVSKRLAQNASGDIEIWAPDCPTNKVLSDTELRAVLTNDDITSINGVPKETFIDVYKKVSGGIFEGVPSELNQDALNQVFSEIKKTRTSDYFDNIKIFYNNKGDKIGIDTTSITGGIYVKPSETLFETSLKETKTFLSESDLKAKYSFLDDLPDDARSIAKSKLTAYEYLESIGADESIIKIRINIVFLLLKPIGKLF